MSWVLVTPPAAQLVDLKEAKQQCRVDGDDENPVLQRAIDAAMSWLDGYRGVLGRCILSQSWRRTIPGGAGTVRFPFPDVSCVSAEFADDAGGAATYVIRDTDRIELRSVQGRPVNVTITAGFGNVSDVPPAIKQAALMLVDFYYNNRGGGSEGRGVPPEVDAMISPFRVWRV